MDDSSFRSFSPDYSQPESPKPLSTKPAGSSGITLVLPSLKSLKAKKTTRHSSSRLAFQDGDIQEKRAPRPLKLKPLKEVLSKLIAQIKRFAAFFLNDLVTDEDFRKDDYAFFLKPVDVANVPGLSSILWTLALWQIRSIGPSIVHWKILRWSTRAIPSLAWRTN